MKTKILLLAALSGAALFSACSKNDSTPNDPNTPGTGTCRLSQISYTTEFDLSDAPVTANVNYSGSQIESITPLPYKFQYVYSGSKVVRRNYYEGSTLFYYDSLRYNSNGAVTLLKGYRGSSRVDSNIYQYSSGQLSKVDYYHQDSAHAGPLYHAYSDFTVSSSGLLTKVSRFDSDSQPYDNYTYTYDTKENKLYTDNNAINLYLQLSDYLYGDQQNIFYDGFLRSKYLPETITHIDDSGTHIYTLTYEFNANDYPTVVKANGVTVIQFQYDCQ